MPEHGKEQRAGAKRAMCYINGTGATYVRTMHFDKSTTQHNPTLVYNDNAVAIHLANAAVEP